MTSATAGTARKRSLYAVSASAFRWVHIYTSMLGFAALMFFGITGITLNHPTWFGAAEQVVQDLSGQVPADVYRSQDSSDSSGVNRLALAEWLRQQHQLKGAVAEFTVDDYEIMVVFKGPGYAADVFLTRETGEYTVTEVTAGAMAVLNDLHKGRDSGTEWSWVIDLSGVVTVLLSLSGFGLLFYVKRRRRTGLLTAVAGTVLLVAVWAVWVP